MRDRLLALIVTFAAGIVFGYLVLKLPGNGWMMVIVTIVGALLVALVMFWWQVRPEIERRTGEGSNGRVVR